jgi:hypothetical protein
MSIADYLKSQAERSLRQAAQVDDEKAALQLKRLAADYLARAAALEQPAAIRDEEKRADDKRADPIGDEATGL